MPRHRRSRATDSFGLNSQAVTLDSDQVPGHHLQPTYAGSSNPLQDSNDLASVRLTRRSNQGEEDSPPEPNRQQNYKLSLSHSHQVLH